jgi:hypothetical protein
MSAEEFITRLQTKFFLRWSHLVAVAENGIIGPVNGSCPGAACPRPAPFQLTLGHPR